MNDNPKLFDANVPSPLEFYALRRFNRISQRQFAEKIGYSVKWIGNVERGLYGDAVPSLLVKALSELTGEPFGNPAYWKATYDKLPEKYKHRRKPYNGLFIEKSPWS